MKENLCMTTIEDNAACSLCGIKNSCRNLQQSNAVLLSFFDRNCVYWVASVYFVNLWAKPLSNPIISQPLSYTQTFKSFLYYKLASLPNTSKNKCFSFYFFVSFPVTDPGGPNSFVLTIIFAEKCPRQTPPKGKYWMGPCFSFLFIQIISVIL